MARKPRVVWLLDNQDPRGAHLMALRRRDLLAPVSTGTALCLRPPSRTPPRGSPLRSVLWVQSLAGRLALASADVVCTTSLRTLAFASGVASPSVAGTQTRPRSALVVHFVHSPVEALMASENYMQIAGQADRVMIPQSADPRVFADAIGLSRDFVVAQDDFVLPAERVLGTAGAKVLLAVGRMNPGTGIRELARGFAEACPDLPGWQLRLCGWGQYRPEISWLVRERGLESRIIILGQTHDVATEYLEAGVVARFATAEACGLSVYEGLSAGLPVLGVATVPAVERLVVHGVNGHVLDRSDPIAVADGLRALDRDDYRARLAAGARSLPSGVVSPPQVRELAALLDVPIPGADLLERLGIGTSTPVRAARSTGPAGPARTGTARPARPFDDSFVDSSDNTADDTEDDEDDDGRVRAGTLVRGTRRFRIMTDLMPRTARTDLLEAVVTTLEAAGARPFVHGGSSFPGPVVGVLEADRWTALEALGAKFAEPSTYLQEVYPGVGGQPVRPLTARRLAAVPERCPAIKIARYWSTPDAALSYRMPYGTTVEFWAADVEQPDHVRPPRDNGVGTLVHTDYLRPATIEREGQSWPSIALFERPLPTDVRFPVDVVYTWVDGADPDWRERFERARAASRGEEYHPQASAENRYVSRDELRYSLRSLDMYAPWVRHVYLVTDRQVPEWLDPSCSKISVVDHRDIYRDPSVLPVFNSSAIITQLHHIEGLAEHYLYLNDDMFFGRDVRPEDFWLGNGMAKVFPSRQRRPFGPSHEAEEPHLNISKNIRTVLEREFGTSISLAIRHTPYPQLVSVNDEIEARFAADIDRTAGQRFRHHDDVALDQLFHYYAQITGRAVASTISYDYVNIASAASVVRLRRLLASRSRGVFCLNDAPEPGEEPMPPGRVEAFLAAYYPLRSQFERPDDGAAGPAASQSAG